MMQRVTVHFYDYPDAVFTQTDGILEIRFSTEFIIVRFGHHTEVWYRSKDIKGIETQ